MQMQEVKLRAYEPRPWASEEGHLPERNRRTLKTPEMVSWKIDNKASTASSNYLVPQ